MDITAIILMQLNPSPTVNGAWHEQLKFPLNKLSLTQSALGSQGIDKQGSGTGRQLIIKAFTKSHLN